MAVSVFYLQSQEHLSDTKPDSSLVPQVCTVGKIYFLFIFAFVDVKPTVAHMQNQQ